MTSKQKDSDIHHGPPKQSTSSYKIKNDVSKYISRNNDLLTYVVMIYCINKQPSK